MLIIDQLKRSDAPLRTLALAVLAGMGVLLAGLLYVQVFSAHRYQTSQVNQSFRTVRIPAIRGRILDVQGVPLAENRPAYHVNLYIEELRPQFSNAFVVASGGRRLPARERLDLNRRVRFQVVSNLISQVGQVIGRTNALDEPGFHEHYVQRLALPLPVFLDLNLAQVSQFVERAAALPGLELEVQPLRHYPQRSLAAHVIGHLRRNDRPEEEDLLTRYSLPDYSGANGVEGAFDRSLRGRPGVKSVLVNNLGYRHSENTWINAEAGENVILTLDVRIQQSAEAALRSAGANTRGAIVVLEAQTGDVLALASNPAFDPNSFLPRMPSDVWATLQDPKRLPLLNRASYGTYMPGSIFKMIIGLAALEAGICDPQQLYHSPGYYQLGKRRIRDTANEGRPDSFDFKKALKQSSNAYFIHYGLLAGVDHIVALGQRFHLGERTGIPVSPESAGILPTPVWRERERNGTWFDGDTANLSIGQGDITVTPLQMAVMTAAFANGGKVLWPRLVARVEPQEVREGAEPLQFPTGRVRDQLAASARSLRLIREAMLGDVEDEDGTGTKARVEGLRICAKTGTAQVRRGGEKDLDTWFASFAPYESPRWVVVVLVESGVSGGTTCAPLARQVYLTLQALDRTRRIPAGTQARVN